MTGRTPVPLTQSKSKTKNILKVTVQTNKTLVGISGSSFGTLTLI
jgi:hypothetical protein